MREGQEEAELLSAEMGSVWSTPSHTSVNMLDSPRLPQCRSSFSDLRSRRRITSGVIERQTWDGKRKLLQ